MTGKPIAVASDHAGFALKALLIDELKASGHGVSDLGTYEGQTSVDYPDYGAAVAETINRGESDIGLLICGTGIGISIAANRHRGIRAALCHDSTTAKLCREHNDANVLVLGARMIGTEVAKDCLQAFLETDFGGDRHIRRVEKLG
ncbi:MAG: ribose 5-phosphate isomerase B [Pseudomonadota bacterium]